MSHGTLAHGDLRHRSSLFVFPLLTLLGAAAPALPTIDWQPATLRLLVPRGSYGRMIRLDDSTIVCVYDRDRDIWIQVSRDDGAHFADPVRVASETRCSLTNAYLLQLKGGTLLCLWDERPLESMPQRRRAASAPTTAATNTPTTTPNRRFCIRLARSIDRGQTWSAPQTLYTAGNTFGDGCWEPAAIQLPSGDVHVYFANESPYRQSDEQEISLLRSHDNGETWSAAQRVSFRAKHRDGMPAPLQLPSTGEIVVAVEDNGLPRGGERFKPSIVRTSDDWKSEPLRAGALADPLPPDRSAGAPFLAQLPDGPTLLSFQESPDGELRHARMAVCIGDAAARGFTHKTYPLPDAPAPQLWNSLFVKSPDTVIAVLSCTIDGRQGLWTIEGRVRR